MSTPAVQKLQDLRDPHFIKEMHCHTHIELKEAFSISGLREGSKDKILPEL